MSVDSWPVWRCCYRQHRQEEGLWRGEAADFLPHSATPLTASIFTAAQPHLRRTLAMWTDVHVPQLWGMSEGILFLDAAAWKDLSAALSVPYGMLAHVLGLPGANARTEPISRRFWGLLPVPNPAKRWFRVYEQVAEALARIQRWVHRVLGYTWSQAEVLQVMEEIAPRVGEVLAIHAVATLALADLIHRAPSAQPEEVYRHLPLQELPTLAPFAAGKGAPEEGANHKMLPWNTRSPFEVAAPRNAGNDLRRVAIALGVPETGAAGSALWAAVGAWLHARERAREALAWVVLAIRAWTTAAAAEGMSDGRLRSADDVYLLELEELKQMMTGEWSDPEPIHRLTDTRRTHWPVCEAPPALDRVTWLEELPATRVEGPVWGAPGWHPSLGMYVSASEGLAALSAGLFAFGRLLAHVQGLQFYEVREE